MHQIIGVKPGEGLSAIRWLRKHLALRISISEAGLRIQNFASKPLEIEDEYAAEAGTIFILEKVLMEEYNLACWGSTNNPPFDKG